jgi:hypothetical protein
MAVDTYHHRLFEHYDSWQTIRDCLSGRSAILANAQRYVEPLVSHRNRSDLYKSYTERGTWLGATARCLDALAGQIFRKDATIVLPRRLLHMASDANGRGEGLQVFAKCTTREVLSVGRSVLLVDRPVDEGQPYLVRYNAEDFTNWRVSETGRLTQAVLREHYEQPADDGFGTVIGTRYRVVELDLAGTYTVRLFVQGRDGGEFLEVESIVPTPTGKPIDYIPLVIINASSLGPTLEKPPLADLADVNIGHFRSSVALENGRHMLAHPVPYMIGVDGGQSIWDASPEVMWQLPQGAQVGLLEFKGDGLGSLERALTEKISYMAALGARLIEEPKRAAETAEALSIRQAAETASLSSIARNVSDGLTAALRIAATWERDAGEVAVELNQDFTDKRLSPQDLRELVAAHLQGVLPLEDLLWSLQQGELIRPGRTLEEVAADLENRPPSLLGRKLSLVNADDAAD